MIYIAILFPLIYVMRRHLDGCMTILGALILLLIIGLWANWPEHEPYWTDQPVSVDINRE